MGFSPDKITVKRRWFLNRRLKIRPADYVNKVPQAVQNSCEKNSKNQSWEEKLMLKTDPLVEDLAKISAFAYKDCKFESEVIQLKMPPATEELRLKEEDCKLEGYKPICYAKKGSYYGCALIKAETNESPCQVIIAHRGTENRKDWKANLEGVCRSLCTSQLNSACTFSLEVVKLVLGAIPQGGSPIQIILTGHSLGGWLAQISTLAVRYAEVRIKENGSRFFRRREDKLNPRCIVFDSPGAYPILRKLYEMDNIRDSNTSSLRLDITNYVISPNLVNCIHAHFGDTFLIPTDKIQKFEASGKFTITGLHIGYTIETHDKMLFVQELAKISHGNGKPIVRVTNWPRVTFGCCPAEVEPPSFFVKTVWSTAYAGWKKFGEYKKWLKNKDNFNLEAEMVVDKHCYTLNEVEIEVMEQIKEICLYKKFGKPDSLYDADENKMLEFVIGNFAGCNWLSSDIYFKFKDKGSLQALRNCSLFSISFQQILEKISTNVVPLFAESEKNRKYLEEHYLELKFISYKEIESVWNKLDGQAHLVVVDKCKAKLKLFLLKIISFRSQNLKRTLILRYDKMRDFLNITGDRYGDALSDIDLVLVNCINSETDITVNGRIKEGCKHIWLIVEGNFSPNSGQTIEFNSLELDRDSVGEILKSKVELLGELVPLQDFIGEDKSKKLEFAEFLTKNPKDMLELVMKNPPLIKVGTRPPTLFDFDNNYFEVGEKFPSLEEAICYVNKKPILLTRTGDGNAVGYVIVICTNLEIPCEIWENLNCNDNVQIVKDDANSFQKFQKVCKKNPNSFVDLLYYSSGFFELRSQYNPGFYIARNISEPGINLRLLCEWRASEDIFTLYLDSEKVDTQQARAPTKIKPAEYRNQIHSGKLVFEGNSVMHTVKESLNPKTIWRRNRAVVDVTSYSKTCRVVMYEKEWGLEQKEDFSIRKYKSSDDKIFNSNDIIILSDEPGMGKSTTIVKLSNAVMALNVGSKPWVIFIELKYLQNIPKISPDDDLCIDKIVACVSGYFKYTAIEYILLRSSLTENGSKRIEIFFVFDGFDEMDYNSQKRFMMVLKWLNLKTNVRICISTRDHDKNKLEVGLCVMAHQFKPLREDEFIPFLVKCWIGIAKQWEEEIKAFATIIILKLRKYLSEEHDKFFGVPLQLKMISEIFSKDIFDAVVANNVDNLTLLGTETMIAEEYTITNLYEDLIQKKYKIYFCNKLDMKPERYFESRKIGFTDRSERVLILLAAETLASDQIVLSDCFKKLISLQYGKSGLICGKDELDGAYAIGIVHQCKRESGKSSKQIPDFPHRTFAEFYMAKLLFMCIKSVCFGVGPQLFDLNSCKVTLVEVFRSYVLPSGGFVVRTFLNDMIASDNEMLSAMKNFEGFNEKLRCLTDTPENETFRFDEDVLQRIVRQNHTFLLAFVLSCFHVYGDEGYKGEHQIEPLLLHLKVLPLHFFMNNYTDLKPLFIILHCIKKHYNGKLEDIRGWITNNKLAKLFYSIDEQKTLSNPNHKLVLDKTANDPLTILLWSENNCFDFPKYLEGLTDTWGDESSVDFIWPRYAIDTEPKVIFSKILEEVMKLNSTTANLKKLREASNQWFNRFDCMYLAVKEQDFYSILFRCEETVQQAEDSLGRARNLLQ